MFRRLKIAKALLSSPRKTHHSLTWVYADWSMPAPQEIKWSVLRRYGQGIDIWVESGTFRGDTTAMLSRKASKVVTIEPSELLFNAAKQRFARNSKVQILFGTSELMLRQALNQIKEPVALWLDGHFSGGDTYSGSQVSPISDELSIIDDFMDDGGSGVLFVDDMRLFEGGESGYPDRSELISWAETRGNWWTIEHDIFVARFGDRNF